MNDTSTRNAVSKETGGLAGRLVKAAALAGFLLCPAMEANAQLRIGPTGPIETRRKSGEPGQPGTRPRRNQPQRHQFRLAPAAEPEPALKYVLTPREEDRRPGNAAPYYYRALLAMQTSPAGRMKELHDPRNYDRWMSGSMATFPKDEVAKFLKKFPGTFANLRVAASREECDWSWRLQDLSGVDAISFIIEEVQQSRELARLVILKIRLAIAEKRFDDAVDWLRIGYKLANDVAEPPTLINDLVGVAIASMMTAEVKNLIAATGSPNMYWALSSLPTPLINIRPAMRYEMSLPKKVFPALEYAETAQHSAEEWANLLTTAVREIQKLQRSGGRRPRPVPEMQHRLMAVGLALRGYPRAKRELVEWGMNPEKVDAMPVGQVVTIHQARVYRHMYQEMMKWTYLPYDQAYAGLQRSEAKLKSEGYFGSFDRSREIIPLTSLLLPTTTLAYRATARVDVRIAGLRVLEAVRMHAAENNGRLPDSLDKITMVPVPRNPATGTHFHYRVVGGRALLDIPAPPGGQKRNGWQLEFTVK